MHLISKKQTTRTLLAAFILLTAITACKKDNTPDTTPVRQERDIFYVVTKNPALALMGGNSTTTHLASEEEWDALLDRFCEYAKSGEQVMFFSNNAPSQAKGTPTTTPTTITTTNSQELKTWMKEMEKAGKTVRVTYDSAGGTWNGTAYANLRPEENLEAQTLSGTLAFVPTPTLEMPPTGGEVWAIRLNNNDTLIITMHGMMIWNDSFDTDYNIVDLEGTSMTLDGVVSQHNDLQGKPFKTIDLVPINALSEKKINHRL